MASAAPGSAAQCPASTRSWYAASKAALARWAFSSSPNRWRKTEILDSPMVARTCSSMVACSALPVSTPSEPAAAPKARSTRPSSATVVPAMSRTTRRMSFDMFSSFDRIAGGRTYRSASSAVVSAIAGEQVMPRPPGPVTSQTPSRTRSRWTTRVVSTHCA